MPANNQNPPKQINGLNTLLDQFCDKAELRKLYEDNNLISQLKNLISVFKKSKKLNKERSSKIHIICENLGDLLLHIRSHELYHFNSIQNHTVELINSIPSPTIDELSLARNAFISAYHSPSDVPMECYRLFNTTDCDGLGVSLEFNLIAQNKNTLEKNITQAGKILKKLHFISQIPSAFDSYINDTKNLDNCLNYLKEEIKMVNQHNETLPNGFIEDLCKFIFSLTEVFKRTNPQSKFYRSSFSLTLTLLKYPFNETKHSFKDISSAINANADQMKLLLNDGLKNSTKNPISRIFSTMDILGDIFHQANDIDIIPPDEKLNIGKKIEEISLICFKFDNCSASLEQFLKTLGAINRNLFKQNKNLTEISQIQAIAKRIVANAQHKIPEDEFKGLAWSFLKGRHDNNVGAIEKNCVKIFNLTDCQEFIFANQTAELDIDTTTIIPETTTITLATNTTLAPVINQTSSSTSISNTTTEFPVSLSNTTFNQTAVDTANTNNDTLANSALTLGASAAHGVGSGLINIITQGTSMWLNNKGYGKSALSAISFSLASGILQASYMATFPFMLLKLNTLVAEGNEDEAQAQWEIMTKEEMLPIFLTSLGISTVLQIANYLSNNYLPKQSIVKGLVQSIPTASSLWSLFQNPIPTGINFGTSYAVSSIGLSGMNRFFSAKNQRQCDIETSNKYVKYNAITKECAVELQPLNEEKTSENEASKKTYQFICLPELDKVKNSSKNNLDQLEKLIKTLEENIQTYELQKKKTNTSGISDALEKSIKDNTYILNILKRQFKSANVLCNELTDDMHLKACEMYTLKRKKDFVSAMEKLGNVFKLMETDFKTLQGEIKAAIGYAEAASANFSDEVKKQLKEFSESIIFPLSQVTLYKDRYSNADAVEKTEKRCKAEANQGVFNALIQADHSIIKRTPTHKEFFNANRNTFAFSRGSGSDSDLRTSTASSSGESELSMTSGNSAHNPIVPQQTAPLLRSFRT